MIVLDNFGTGRTLHQVHTRCAFQCNFTQNLNTVWCSLVYWTLVHGIRQYRNIYGKLLCAYVCNVCDKHNIGILSFGVCTIIWYDGMVGHGIVPYGMDVQGGLVGFRLNDH